MLGLISLVAIAVGWDFWVLFHNRRHPEQRRETISTVVGRHPILGGLTIAGACVHFWGHRVHHG